MDANDLVFVGSMTFNSKISSILTFPKSFVFGPVGSGRVGSGRGFDTFLCNANLNMMKIIFHCLNWSVMSPYLS